MQVVPGRYETIDEGQNFQVIIDTANTPDPLNAMLHGLRKMDETQRIITVIGASGDKDKGVRPELADVAYERSDVVIFTNESPGTEAPDAIIAVRVPSFHCCTHAAGC